jgi:VIT1/CCC1 family predicted Fe2+/Mn2+ transporter
MVSVKSIQTEIDAAYLYNQLAKHEEDENVANIFRQMSEIEAGHAKAFLQNNHLPLSPLPKPSAKARLLNALAKVFGYNIVLDFLMNLEKGLSQSVIQAKQKSHVPLRGTEANHVAILSTLLSSNPKVAGMNVARFEKRHRSVGGNALRAAVLGGNDGLVSNFSLVMGVAGATNGNTILLTGLAGLLAGALSMALGEWVSVKSSQELSENQMSLEMEEIESNPEGEEKELALIYMAKGVSEQEANEMAQQVMSNKEEAQDVLIKEELGINKEELKGSAIQAAVFSFFSFAVGAIIPVLAFLFFSGSQALLFCGLFSALGLFLIGAAITLFTGKSVWFSGFRQVIFGLAAAAITYGIGKLIGVSMAG